MFCKKLIYLNNNELIYDIGSGNSTILNELGNSTYYGFDISQEYISKAKKSFYDRPNAYLYCSEFNEELGEKLPKADLVMMKGVLHHMGDDEIINLVSGISQKLKTNGVFLSIDPTYIEIKIR